MVFLNKTTKNIIEAYSANVDTGFYSMDDNYTKK